VASRLVLDSAIGPLGLVAADGALTHIWFLDEAPRVDEPVDSGDGAVLDAACTQLEQYFSGTRREFDVPLAPRGSAFQRRVWAELLEVPWGTTVSYGAIAKRLALPVGSSRAVGSANGANPIPVIVPCHRVIGSNGLLTGYAGGLHRKELLLRLEGVATERDQLALFD
jgi:methylated-DNA-[protein]-cysteine S-methyltransferase